VAEQLKRKENNTTHTQQHGRQQHWQQQKQRHSGLRLTPGSARMSSRLEVGTDSCRPLRRLQVRRRRRRSTADGDRSVVATTAATAPSSDATENDRRRPSSGDSDAPSCSSRPYASTARRSLNSFSPLTYYRGNGSLRCTMPEVITPLASR